MKLFVRLMTLVLIGLMLRGSLVRIAATRPVLYVPLQTKGSE